MRRGLPSFVTFALVALAAVALAQVSSTPPARAAAFAATGSFEISDSHDGQPIFAATGIAPGGSTSGTVSIEDAGSEPVALTLHQEALVDTPGLGGALLSGRLALSVVDVTEPAAPRSLYDGPLDSMPAEPAGELAAGEPRTFEFTVSLPGAGTPGFQNAVQGAATTVAYSWVATEASGGEEDGGSEPPGAPAPGGGAPSGETPAGSGEVGGGSGGSTGSGPGYEPIGGGAGATRDQFALRVPRIKRNLRHGRVVAWIICDRACRLSVRGRLLARIDGVRHGARLRVRSQRLLPAGPHRVSIRIPPGLERRLLESSTPVRLRARLRFLAVGTDDKRDSVRIKVHLRVRRR